VAFKLRQAGFTRIRPLQGGLDAWIEAGLPVAGEEPDARLA
jgi:rhodanese-related sulfurtransferase